MVRDILNIYKGEEWPLFFLAGTDTLAVDYGV